MKIHHIGYLVKKIDKAKNAFLGLGYQPASGVIYDDIRKIDACFMKKGDYCIELVSPAAEDSVVSGLFKQYRNSPYHICYESAEFESDIEQLRRGGYLFIQQPCPAPALNNRRVAFFISPDIGIIELLEATGGLKNG
jgi:methylmalonyl-CoA/ethylmalonyl-CoA epimerase